MIFSILFSVLLLFLIVLLLWHGGLGFGGFSLDSILGRPAAVINGEAISRSDLNERVKAVRAMLERQYGKNAFAGERGRALQANLEEEVLDGMVEERLVAQEARRLKIQISNDMVRQEFQRIGREIYGTWENFQSKLQEDGVSEEDLQNHIRNLLSTEAVKAAKARPGLDSDVSFHTWLLQAKRNAVLSVYHSRNGAAGPSNSPGGCCAVDESGRPGRDRAGMPVGPETEKEAQRLALEAYRETHPSGQGITARVTDYGCHLQVDIQKEGKVIKSYIYQDGKVFENS